MNRYLRLILIVIAIAAVAILAARYGYDVGRWIGSR